MSIKTFWIENRIKRLAFQWMVNMFFISKIGSPATFIFFSKLPKQTSMTFFLKSNWKQIFLDLFHIILNIIYLYRCPRWKTSKISSNVSLLIQIILKRVSYFPLNKQLNFRWMFKWIRLLFYCFDPL
jgi:hypothetical protein